MNISNVITAVVVGGRATAMSKRYMTDRGQYLNIIGLDLPEVYRVDFSNDEHKGNYVRMVGNADGVLVPSQYLASGLDVWAFPVLVTETAERTLATIRIININRPANNVDPQPEPEQESAIDQAISALNTAVERTAWDVLDADQSAQEAGQSAEQAHEASIDAQNFAEQAEQSAEAAATSASQASTSAQSASQSASQSAQIKTDVEGMVSDAQASAAASAQSASAASASASSAATSAQTATTKAAEASTSASSAASSASTAGTKAAEASASATTASAKASEAAQSASTASTKATEANTAKTAAQTAQTAAETAQGAAEDAQEAAETAAESIEASAAQIATNTSDIADVKRDLNDKAPVVIETVSGSIASFADGADDMPMKSLVVDIEPVQSGSGDPSPDNVRPISGWTGCEVNVSPTTDAQDGTTYPISWQTEAGTVYGGTLDVVSGVLTVDRAIVTLNSELSYSIGIGAERNRVTWNGYEFLGKLNGTFVSDKLTTVANASGGYGSADWQIYGSIVAPRMWITVPSNIASVSDVTAYFAENPVQVVYELATPQTYQLTSTEVLSLYGLNHVWADCGDVEVEYRADTKMFVESQISVEDVQINGSSVVSDGVAEIPVVTPDSSTLGLVRPQAGLGTAVASNGGLAVVKANPTQVKAGANEYAPIVPQYQHQSTFYGLTKAAGVDMASSSNAVGTYTDKAKVAIQKMLGIYEAPWELIREDTFTNAEEADHIISTDANGETFELTDVAIMFYLPKQSNVSKKGRYGQIGFFKNGQRIFLTEHGAWEQAVDEAPKGLVSVVENHNGMINARTSLVNKVGYAAGEQMRIEKINSTAVLGTIRFANDFSIDSVNIYSVTGTGSYQLYGKRKWQ